MRVKATIRNLLDSAVRPYGYTVADIDSLYEWQRPKQALPRAGERTSAYLVEDNPRLVDLRTRYSKFDRAVTTADLWQVDHIVGERLRYFRGDDAYVWQLRGPNMNVLGYALTSYYVQSIDTIGFLSRLTDDDWFGNVTFPMEGAVVSRDLLDSLIELYFLERHLNISSLQHLVVIDVGAGYGRLAHRTCQCLTNIHKYLCVDAVAQSTFVSEFYLKFRDSRAKVIPLDEIEDAIKTTTPLLAVNVHSFSECRLSAIEWWLRVLSMYGVRYLMIVPNDRRHDGGQTLVTNRFEDFGHLVTKYGYKLLVKEPKYRDPTVQKYAINPTHHFLFELS